MFQSCSQSLKCLEGRQFYASLRCPACLQCLACWLFESCCQLQPAHPFMILGSSCCLNLTAVAAPHLFMMLESCPISKHIQIVRAIDELPFSAHRLVKTVLCSNMHFQPQARLALWGVARWHNLWRCLMARVALPDGPHVALPDGHT